MTQCRDVFARTLQSATRAACVAVALSSTSAFAQSNDVDELRRRLDEKEMVISDLLRRVQALESRTEAPAARADPTRTAARPSSSTPAAPTDKSAGIPATAADEEQTDRALERALVREGALVLRRGVYEIEPSFTYRHRATNALQIVNINGQASVAAQSVRRDILDSSLALRAGLPWNSQIGIRVPYVFTRDELNTAASQQQTRDRSGLGDVELAWTKQFMREARGLPNVLGSLTWTSRTGEFGLGDVTSPGGGFNVLQAGLTAVQRQDPLVFYGSLTHSWTSGRNIAGNQVEPGNALGLKVGALLAASPETSLRFAFEASRSARTELNGFKIPGSDSSVGLLEFGVASVLSARTVLDFRIAIGVTPDAPNYRVGLAVPIRFY